MKKGLAGMLTVVLLVLLFSVTAAAENYLFNFGEGAQGLYYFEGHSRGSELNVDEEKAFSGEASLRIDYYFEDGEEMIHLQLEQPEGIESGETYVYRVYVPADTELVAVQPYIASSGWNPWIGNYAELPEAEDAEEVLSYDEWLEIEVDFTDGRTPPEDIGIQLFRSDDGSDSGSVWLDSIIIK